MVLVDEAGKLVAERRVGDDVQGYQQLLTLLAESGDSAGEPVPVAVETARGLLISCLRATGRKVYSINPMAVARYRERRTVARANSDHADAMALANILRTDADAHRPLPADSELVQAIAVLARAQQDAVWNRGQLSNQLRSHLKQYFPAALAAFQIKGVGRFCINGWWPADGDVIMFNPGAVRTTRYRYRGAKIPSPWPGAA